MTLPGLLCGSAKQVHNLAVQTTFFALRHRKEGGVQVGRQTKQEPYNFSHRLSVYHGDTPLILVSHRYYNDTSWRRAMVGISKRTLGQPVLCTRCGETKPWDIAHFRVENSKPRMPCKACDGQLHAASIASRGDIARQFARERTRRWRARNPEKAQESWRRPRSFDKVRAKERIREWKRAHPDHARTQYHKRKAKHAQLPYTFTRSDWERCLEYWGCRCCVCGRQENDQFLIAQEHWIPIADARPNNPGTVAWNIVPMCHSRHGATGGCNNSKWAKRPDEWLVSRVGTDRASEVEAAIHAYFTAVTPPVMRMLLERCVESLT